MCRAQAELLFTPRYVAAQSADNCLVEHTALLFGPQMFLITLCFMYSTKLEQDMGVDVSVGAFPLVLVH